MTFNSRSFRKGNSSKSKPVGSVRVDHRGFVWIKCEDLTWRQKHLLAWEQSGRSKPEGSVIAFLDGDRSNCDIDNLMAVSRRELARMNRRPKQLGTPDMRKAAIQIARLELMAIDQEASCA